MATFSLGTPVSAITFSADNLKLAAATADGRVQIFGPSIPGVQPTREWTLWQEIRAAAPVTDLRFTADGRSVWLSLESGAIERWAIAAPGPVRQFNHGGPVYGTAVSWTAARLCPAAPIRQSACGTTRPGSRSSS